MAKKVEWDTIFRFAAIILSVSATIYFMNLNKAKSIEFRRINTQKINLLKCQEWIKKKVDDVVKNMENQIPIKNSKKYPPELLKNATLTVNQNSKLFYPLQTPLLWEASSYHHIPGFNIGFLDRDVHFYEISQEQILKELKKIDALMKDKKKTVEYEFPFSYTTIKYKKYKKLFSLKKKE
ncbi:MAG: hypothetical protein COA79_07945 [Planctomycetota bacterium]|nr:MAG: hypothetical protein COA79_07945 [Planctomycetota bacterium]